MTPAVDMHNVDFAYENQQVLENVHLTIEQGRFVCFAGPNGGGKSTLFRLILGLLRPDRGEIRVLGRKPEQARTEIGYVPQNFTFDPRFPVRVSDVVGMGCLGPEPGSGRRGRIDRRRIEAALEEVGLKHAQNDWFRNLSGGQRQRVLIARALATAPKMLLLDEPTSNVDAMAQEAILDVLTGLRGRMTMLLVTHNASVVGRFLETIVCVNRRVHPHPQVTYVDDKLMRHISGFEPLPEPNPACHPRGE